MLLAVGAAEQVLVGGPTGSLLSYLISAVATVTVSLNENREVTMIVGGCSTGRGVVGAGGAGARSRVCVLGLQMIC